MLILRFPSVGGWLTHGDLALEVKVDNLVVVEHGLIPARVRIEWAMLKAKEYCVYEGSCFTGLLSCW